MIDVKIKKINPNATIPSKANMYDAGFDLTATGIDDSDINNGVVVYSTGLSIEIPDGYVGYIFPRSSIYKKDIRLSNSVGVIDSGYRGEIKCIFDLNYMDIGSYNLYEIGDRVAQLIIMPIPTINLLEVSDLSDSERGIGGFGSSGN